MIAIEEASDRALGGLMIDRISAAGAITLVAAGHWARCRVPLGCHSWA
ncbi:hypothetical protein AB0C40_21025 [Streptomyces brevispora]